MFRFIALSHYISPLHNSVTHCSTRTENVDALALSFNFLACRFSTARIYRPLSLALALSFSLRLCVEVLINPAAGRRQRNCLPTCRQKTSSPPPRPASSTWFVIIPHNGSRLSHHSFRSFGLQGFRVFSKDKFLFMMTPANLSGTIIPFWFKIV